MSEENALREGSEFMSDLDEKPRSVILALLGQLKKGMDLHRISFPTFVLEPRSLLERITDFMSHQQLIFKYFRQMVFSRNSTEADPLNRMVNVVMYFLSGWHIRPKGVKKPYNPVLGEFFRCSWKCPDGSVSYYVAEQVSHHPPNSAYFYINPSHGLIAEGNFCPKSRFLGNSVVSLMEGMTKLYFISRPSEVYTITNPNVYARGIMFGKTFMELGDKASIKCSESGLECEINFKFKGFFTGGYDEIEGCIRDKMGHRLFHIAGSWSGVVDVTPSSKAATGATLDVGLVESVPKISPPLEAQSHLESQHLWKHVTEALRRKNYEEAGEQKYKIEEEQRKLAKLRDDDNLTFSTKFFAQSNADWSFIFLENL